MIRSLNLGWIQTFETAVARNIEVIDTPDYLDVVIFNSLCNYTNFQCVPDIYRLNETQQQVSQNVKYFSVNVGF